MPLDKWDSKHVARYVYEYTKGFVLVEGVTDYGLVVHTFNDVVLRVGKFIN